MMRSAFALLALLLLTGCGDTDENRAVRNMTVTGGPYYTALHERYVNLADMRGDVPDKPGSRHFFTKAKKAGQGKNVSPDKLDGVTIPAASQRPLEIARGDLQGLLERGAMLYNPVDVADALVAFDCWLWQVKMEEDPTCEESFMDIVKHIKAHQQTLTVVLLADYDGSVGSVVVSNEHGQRVLTREGETTQLSAAEPAPSETYILDAKEISERYLESLQAHPVPPAKFILYFEQNSSELTPESRAMLRDAAREIAHRTIVGVSVIGHTDRVSSEAYNRQLSMKRTDRVIQSLIALDVDADIIHTTSHGEHNPLVPTADNVPEPRNRRVEVIVR